MSDLKGYLATRTAAPLDPQLLAEYDRNMREITIPKIVADMRANARRVAELRHKALFR